MGSERVLIAKQMRASGKSLGYIAKQLGYKTKSGAQHAVASPTTASSKYKISLMLLTPDGYKIYNSLELDKDEVPQVSSILNQQLCSEIES